MQGDPHPYTRRVNFDQRLDQVLSDICVEGAQWKRDAQGKPIQLRRLDLKPVAKGWLEFIQRSIIPTSNRSEVTIDRAIMIHCIMIGSEVEIHEVIPQELYKKVEKPSTLARLAFPYLICHLCNLARIVIEGDIPLRRTSPSLEEGWSKLESLHMHSNKSMWSCLNKKFLRCLKGCIFLSKAIGTNCLLL
ncbi:hypothetical protein AHAS_Ahas20G0206600 [Arachis hypogaea]